MNAAAQKIRETCPEMEIRHYAGSIRFEAALLRQAIGECDALRDTGTSAQVFGVPELSMSWSRGCSPH